MSKKGYCGESASPPSSSLKLGHAARSHNFRARGDSETSVQALGVGKMARALGKANTDRKDCQMLESEAHAGQLQCHSLRDCDRTTDCRGGFIRLLGDYVAQLPSPPAPDMVKLRLAAAKSWCALGAACRC